MWALIVYMCVNPSPVKTVEPCATMVDSIEYWSQDVCEGVGWREYRKKLEIVYGAMSPVYKAVNCIEVK